MKEQQTAPLTTEELTEKYHKLRRTFILATVISIFGTIVMLPSVLFFKVPYALAGALVLLTGESMRYRIKKEMRALARCWRALWMNSLRPFGFEVIDIRLSAQIGRLETARERIGAFAQGRLDDIPELTEEKLPYLKRADGTLANLNIWSACVSPTNVSWSF